VEADLRRRATEPAPPASLCQEVRWLDALAAGRAGDWALVTRLAEEGLGEPFSERESIRLAFLHCLAGAVEEAEHLLSQAIQLHGDAGVARLLAAWCEAEGLQAAAGRLRLGPASDVPGPAACLPGPTALEPGQAGPPERGR
jgi:hypothetical protein